MTRSAQPKLPSTIRSGGLIARGDRILIAASGGADSTALLHLLAYLAPRMGFEVRVGHVHHGLRGRAADADEAFVRYQAQRIGLPFVSQRVDVRGHARATGLSIEMAARVLRYQALEAMAEAEGCNKAALAHHADDQAETALLRLCRGAGPRGPLGMPKRRMMGRLALIRPLLDIRRETLEAFLKAHRLPWREDAGNRSTDMLRNRVRLRVLPLIERAINPRAREALARAATLMRDEEDWLQDLTRKRLARCRDSRSAHALRTDRLNRLSVAAARRVLHAWLLEHVDPARLDFETVESIRQQVLGTNRSRMSLPGGYVAEVSNDTLALRGPAPAAPAAHALKGPGLYDWPDWGLRVTLSPSRGFRRTATEGIARWPAEAWIDAGKLGDRKLRIRSRRPGDRMRPTGTGGTRKAQDMLTDARVPRDARDRVPLLVCGREVVWIAGGRVADGWKVRDRMAPSWHIRIEALA